MKASKVLGVGAIVMAIVGLAGVQGNAAPFTFQAELASGETGQVSPSKSTVAFDLYVVITSSGADANDGVNQTWGGLKTTGTLLGDLTFGLVSAFKAGPAPQDGNQIDLDGDTDLDIGSTVHNTNPGWIFADALANFVMGDRVKIGSGVFTLTDPSPVLSETTDLVFVIRNKTDGATYQRKIHAMMADSAVYSMTGGDTNLAVGTPMRITYVPEPMTLGLLALGGLGLLRRRRS